MIEGFELGFNSSKYLLGIPTGTTYYRHNLHSVPKLYLSSTNIAIPVMRNQSLSGIPQWYSILWYVPYRQITGMMWQNLEILVPKFYYPDPRIQIHQ